MACSIAYARSLGHRCCAVTRSSYYHHGLYYYPATMTTATVTRIAAAVAAESHIMWYHDQRQHPMTCHTTPGHRYASNLSLQHDTNNKLPPVTTSTPTKTTTTATITRTTTPGVDNAIESLSSSEPSQSNTQLSLIGRMNPEDQRPMTAGERFGRFPKAVYQLWRDCNMYRDIHDASRTRLNAWTIDHPFKKKWPTTTTTTTTNTPSAPAATSQDGSGPTPRATGTIASSTSSSSSSSSRGSKSTSNASTVMLMNRTFHIYEDEARPGRIPRRQHEQQRRVRNDVARVLPLVLLWIPPIIGYLPMILAVVAPRQVLSRQFHNEYEVYHYNELEYYQRRKEYAKLAEMFWVATTMGPSVSSRNVRQLGQDAAGPIIDPLPFYEVFENRTGVTDDYILRRGVLSDLVRFPREYLEQFALAIGIHQFMPPPFNRFATAWSPTLWLRFEVRRAALVVREDDDLLLREGHDQSGCVSLTDLEVMDACLMRGLPVHVSVEEMRECLTNHLQMIASVKNRLPSGPMTEGFGIFTLHLAIIRAFLKDQQ